MHDQQYHNYIFTSQLHNCLPTSQMHCFSLIHFRNVAPVLKYHKIQITLKDQIPGTIFPTLPYVSQIMILSLISPVTLQHIYYHSKNKRRLQITGQSQSFN